MRVLHYLWATTLTLLSACGIADPVLRQGLEDADREPGRARATLRPYAQAGQPAAVAAICVAYGRSIDGSVGTAERQQAFGWCQQAAGAGHVPATYHLAMFYKSGIGTPVDREAALQWFKRAASLGHREAENEARGLQGQARICRNWVTGCKLF